jgi:allantoinase
MMQDWLIGGKKVFVQGESSPIEAKLWIKEGKIHKVLRARDPVPDLARLDIGNKVLLPGLVDSHAHINEPGRTEWEGFHTATQAAAAGGITTVIDMPLNSIPATTTLAALETKKNSAASNCAIHIGFWGGVVPGNSQELEPMIRDGIFGFKAFLCPSGVAEFPMATERDLLEAMPILARFQIPLLVHAEIESPVSVPTQADPRAYRSYLDSRPPSWEMNAIQMMIRLSEKTGCPTHIVHLSSASALPDLVAAKKRGVKISVETCPHYLSFCSEEIPDGAIFLKCSPPIRDRVNREALWQGLKNGEIDFIVSDHSPCTPNLKHPETGEFKNAWGGISGLQTSLSVVWTQIRARNLGLSELVRWMSYGPSHFLGLDARKGSIAEGKDADLVVFDPESSFILEEAQILHRHKTSPYSGQKLLGQVEMTFVRGTKVYDRGKLSAEPSGHLLTRND